MSAGFTGHVLIEDLKHELKNILQPYGRTFFLLNTND